MVVGLQYDESVLHRHLQSEWMGEYVQRDQMATNRQYRSHQNHKQHGECHRGQDGDQLHTVYRGRWITGKEVSHQCLNQSDYK